MVYGVWWGFAQPWEKKVREKSETTNSAAAEKFPNSQKKVGEKKWGSFVFL